MTEVYIFSKTQILSRSHLEMFSWCVSNSMQFNGQESTTISWYVEKTCETITGWSKLWMKSMANGQLLSIDYRKTTLAASCAQEEDSKWEQMIYLWRRLTLKEFFKEMKVTVNPTTHPPPKKTNYLFRLPVILKWRKWDPWFWSSPLIVQSDIWNLREHFVESSSLPSLQSSSLSHSNAALTHTPLLHWNCWKVHNCGWAGKCLALSQEELQHWIFKEDVSQIKWT